MHRSSHFPNSHYHQLGISLSIAEEDRPLEPVVLTIGRVKAWRRSEVVLARGDRFAGGDAIQDVLCAMP